MQVLNVRQHAIVCWYLGKPCCARCKHAHGIDVADCWKCASSLFPPVASAGHGGVARGNFVQQLG
eukprot:8486552-Alexandrium_andersonii.AAC.1